MTVTSQSLDAERLQYEQIIQKFKDAGKEDKLKEIQAECVQTAIGNNRTIVDAIGDEVRTRILQKNGGRGLDPDDF